MRLAKNSKLKAILTWLFSLVIFFYCLIWIFSSPLFKYFLAPTLADYQLKLNEKSTISFNPFLTRLSIKNLELSSDKETVVVLDDLQLQLSLMQLPFKRVVFQQAEIKGLFIRASKHGEEMQVAGISLSSSNKNGEEQKSTPDQGSQNPYQVLLDNFSLSDSQFIVGIEGEQHQLDIEQLDIGALDISEKQQQADISLSAIIDAAPLQFSAALDLLANTGAIESTLTLNDYQVERLGHFIPAIETLSGQLNIQSEQRIKLEKGKASVSLTNARLNTQGLVIKDSGYRLVIENQQIVAKEIQLPLEHNGEFGLSGRISYESENAELAIQETNQPLVHLGHLATQDIDIQSQNGGRLSLPELYLTDIQLSNTKQADIPPLIRLDKVSFKGIVADSAELVMDSLELSGLDASIIRDNQKHLASLIKLPQQEEPEPVTNAFESKEEQGSAPEAAPPYDFTLRQLSFTDESKVAFIDNGVDPVYQRSFFIDRLELGEISSKRAEQETPFRLAGRSNKYAKYDLHGYIMPLAGTAKYHVQGELNEVSLPGLSTYVKDALQFELLSGQLSSQLDVTLTGDEIKGQVDLMISGLETTSANDYQAGSLKDQTAIPLNVALDMLKDGQGNVELALPFSGKTSNPKFGFTSFLTLVTKRAVMSATQSYLLNTFVPYANVVSVALSAGEFVLKVRFEDLIYQAEQIEPAPEQEEYLKQFVLLMKDKPDTKVKICAISTPEDIGLQPDITTLDKAEIKKLKDISSRRQEAFKEHVIRMGGIKSSRLLMCSPQLDASSDAKPRISLSV